MTKTRRFLVRKIKFNKAGARVGGFVAINAMNEREALRIASRSRAKPVRLAPGQARRQMLPRRR